MIMNQRLLPSLVPALRHDHGEPGGYDFEDDAVRDLEEQGERAVVPFECEEWSIATEEPRRQGVEVIGLHDDPRLHQLAISTEIPMGAGNYRFKHFNGYRTNWPVVNVVMLHKMHVEIIRKFVRIRSPMITTDTTNADV